VIRATAFATALLLLAGSGVRAGDPSDPVEARAFEIQFRPLAEASELVTPLLSADGSVTLQPRLGLLTVQDRRSALDRIAAVLESFDVAPRNVEVTVGLFLGTDRRDAEAGRGVAEPVPSREVRGVSETLGDFTKWNAYSPLGSRSVTGAEGSRVEVPIGDDYRIAYGIEAVQDRGGGSNAMLRGFTLERRTGPPEAPVWRLVYRADILLPSGRMLVVGAAQNPESKKALFVTLQARPR
jgi:hypothetical protein